jgi:CRISPR-associated endonuclease/helicase Cas3
MPAHLDLLCQTSPVPAADPEVALYLHGLSRQPDAVTVIWRADVDPAWEDQDVVRLLTLVPPRTGEAIELPLWAVRRWLMRIIKEEDFLADVSVPAPDEPGHHGKDRKAFCWKGVDERSRWVKPHDIRLGDTIVVPASYGGVDDHGWHPESTEATTDLADTVACAYRGRRFAVRVAPGLLGDAMSSAALSETLAAVRQEKWQTVCDVLSGLRLPEERKQLLNLLSQACGRRGHSAIDVHFDLYGTNNNDEPRGVVFVAPFGIKGGLTIEEGRPSATEDDVSGSLYGFAQTLNEHSEEVETKTESFARAAGLPEDRIADLKLAGFLHDQGKRDIRFQRWLHYGDPLGADPDDESTILAKSGRALPPHARDKAGLPPRWRHEALSVRLARTHERLKTAKDRELVLWLVGTHHGYGRPLYPHADPRESTPDVGPQSLAFDWDGKDWATLFQTLKMRYGTWELARMEAILRLADHRASEEAAKRGLT